MAESPRVTITLSKLRKVWNGRVDEGSMECMDDLRGIMENYLDPIKGVAIGKSTITFDPSVLAANILRLDKLLETDCCDSYFYTRDLLKALKLMS